MEPSGLIKGRFRKRIPSGGVVQPGNNVRVELQSIILAICHHSPAHMASRAATSTSMWFLMTVAETAQDSNKPRETNARLYRTKHAEGRVLCTHTCLREATVFSDKSTTTMPRSQWESDAACPEVAGVIFRLRA
eukprot:3758193-Pyramimonas_sp.AAC.1